jgi:asparagine synthase (glutamine-hydrolysing)
MCGIAGVYSPDRLIDPDCTRAELGSMLAPLTHRGPDDQDILTSKIAGFGHVRLSIIDLATGQQPMQSADGNTWVSFNGEIFNYIELREDLKRRGSIFRTQSDTEVLLHLYERYGEDLVDHLQGQFCFAVFDSRARKLVLVRDRVGILPLYYTWQDGQLLFASEIKSLLAHPTVRPEPDYLGLQQVSTFWSPVAPRTTFKNICELPPGQMMVCDAAGTRTHTYWRWNYPDNEHHEAELTDEMTESVRATLEDAARIRLRADVPVGAYLSGGLDSSVLTSLIASEFPEQLRTFSLRFGDPALNEADHQNEMVDWLQTRHTGVDVRDSDIAENFMATIWHAETPLMRMAAAPMGMLSRRVREMNYKVVLTGEGADEVFVGYDIFKEAKLRAFCARDPASKKRPQLIRRLYPYLDFDSRRDAQFVDSFFRNEVADYPAHTGSHHPRWLTSSRSGLFFHPSWQPATAEALFADLNARLPENFDRLHPINQAQTLELTPLMPGYLLASQGDRMLMRHSVEGHFPFLDHRVIELVNRIHPRHLLQGLNEKALLKRLFRRQLPDNILCRYKQPYRAPDVQPFQTGVGREIANDLLSTHSIRNAGLFDCGKVAKLREKIGKATSISYRDSMSYVLVLSSQAWYKLFVESSAAASKSNVTE